MSEQRHDSQYSKDMSYPGEMHVNMNKRGSTGSLGGGRTSGDAGKMVTGDRTERHDVLGKGVVTKNAIGVTRDGKTGDNFNFPTGTDPKKRVPPQPMKMGKTGKVKGGF